MKDTGARITLEILIETDGAWISNRALLSPGNFPRTIKALESLVANMKDELAEWERKP